MFCTKCGSQIPDDANFCPKCQAPVNKSYGIDSQKISNNHLTFLESGCSVQNLKFRIIGFVGILLLLIGNLLPVISVKHVQISISYIRGYGFSVIIMVIITAILLLMQKDLFACIPAGISAILILSVVPDIFMMGRGMIKLSIGFYVMCLGVIAIVANFFLVKKNIHIIK